jgi:hypothetical protein
MNKKISKRLFLVKNLSEPNSLHKSFVQSWPPVAQLQNAEQTNSIIISEKICLFVKSQIKEFKFKKPIK